jgi:hypothetical protein
MSTVRIGQALPRDAAQPNRISYEVDGLPVWYESSDLDLQATPEALGSAFVTSCLLDQRQLELDQPVCDRWHANLQELIEFISESWGVEKIPVQARTAVMDDAPSTAAGLFFSGGIDSFYILLNTDPKPDYLLYVDGHGVPLSGDVEIAHVRRRLDNVGSAFGSRTCIVRTNVWDHPKLNAHHIADTHSSLLAAVGHFLAPHMGSVTISPGWHKAYPAVYGCHWHSDPLRSSRQLKVIHGENSLTRTQRVVAVAGERIVQENLRVCWEHKFQAGNCSRCEKCIRTMVELHAAGKLEEFTVFDLSVPIWDLVDRLPAVRRTVYYMDAMELGVDPRLEAALRRLFRRSYVNEWALQRQEQRIQQLQEKYRHVSEDYPKLQEGLNNALHHYRLLQDSFDNLSADYHEVVGRLPVKRSIRMLRQFIGLLRSWRRTSAVTVRDRR